MRAYLIRIIHLKLEVRFVCSYEVLGQLDHPPFPAFFMGQIPDVFPIYARKHHKFRINDPALSRAPTINFSSDATKIRRRRYPAVSIFFT